MLMLFRGLALLGGLACCSVTFCGQAAAQTKPAGDALYQAWGQKAGIRAVVDDLWVRLLTDQRTAHFFKDINRERLLTHLTDQLCVESGGPCSYEGDPMGPVHQGLGIGVADFNAMVELLQQSMTAKGIPFAAQNGMLARLAPMHRDIITRP